MHRWIIPILLTLATAVSRGDPPAATQPSRTGDDALDFVLGASTPTTRPAQADQPTSQPASPFANKPADGARPGLLVLSNGEKIHGQIATTAGKPLRVWVESKKEYSDVPYALVRTIEASVLWERDEKEWRFKESGSDIKEFSGKTYPARELIYKLTLVNGQTVEGGIVAPLYLLTKDGHATFVLYKRQKGEVGQSLKDLAYVAKVEFMK